LKTVVEKIEALTREPGFIYTLALILMRDVFLFPEDIADINPHEHLNMQELTFLIGLLVKDRVDFTLPTEDESSKRFETTYLLFEELHRKYNEPFLDHLSRNITNGLGKETPKENYRRIFGSGLTASEPIFYSATGAYDFQYLEFAVAKYRNDARWISEHVGLSVEEMANIARELKRLQELKFNELPTVPPGDFSGMCRAGLSVFCFEEQDIGQFGTAAAAFLRMFALTPGTANAKLQRPGQFNELQSKPLIRLPDSRYFLPIGFDLSEAIYEGPFYWMNTDKSYSATALLNRGNFAEAMTAEFLRSVFGTGSVHTDVEVRERKGRNVTDIDVLAIAGNKAVIAQVKSKRLTELAKLGEEERLVADFGLAVQEAYDQGLLCRKAVIDHENKLFVGGVELRLQEAIDEAYILCVTLDYYPAITHQVDVYLRKAPADPFPVALSIFDLDVIAFYLHDPFEFMYYLRQRTSLSDYFKADSEMTLLGHHLRHKLFKSGSASMEILDASYGRLIDANFQVMRGSVPRTAAADKLYAKWQNEDFKRLINQAKSTGDPRFADVVFFLYDLAGKGADDLIEILRLTKRKANADQKPHDARAVFKESKSGVTVLVEPRSPALLRRKLLPLARVAKYKSKADVWLALGCVATSENVVDAIAFAKYEWRPDSELERVASHFQGRLMRPSGRKIGRNEACPCDSGKKFKHCHGR
jgi:SEC-C motif